MSARSQPSTRLGSSPRAPAAPWNERGGAVRADWSPKARGRTDLVRAPALHVAEADHGALGGRQRLDRPFDDSDRLACEQSLFGKASGRRSPVIGPPRMRRVEEARGSTDGSTSSSPRAENGS